MTGTIDAETQSAAQTQRTVSVNGVATTTAALTLAELLTAQGFAGTKVATAINSNFVPARERANRPLAEGDHIEVVSARQGG